MRQAEIFANGEGDAWLARNRDKLGQHDPVCDLLDELGIKPTRVLEIGCANGWRLKKMRARYGCDAWGVEPSLAASAEDPQIVHGDASQLFTGSFSAAFDGAFDLIIFGFCLYLIDRDSLFTLAAETDLLLRSGGHLVIHDFRTPHLPFARRYEHHDGVMSYHMDNAGLWLAHPYYYIVASCWLGPDEQVDVLRKDVANAFPEEK